MILFFDRGVGKRFPVALRTVKLASGIEVQCHDDIFKMNTPDDEWLAQVGAWGWIVLGQDYHYHTLENGLEAIEDYQIGCFYLEVATVTAWEKLRVFARAYHGIIQRAEETPRPFVYRITKDGRILPVKLGE